MGTTEFDLANGSVESARYVKIVDDGTGSPSEVNPGVRYRCSAEPCCWKRRTTTKHAQLNQNGPATGESKR